MFIDLKKVVRELFLMKYVKCKKKIKFPNKYKIIINTYLHIALPNTTLRAILQLKGLRRETTLPDFSTLFLSLRQPGQSNSSPLERNCTPC